MLLFWTRYGAAQLCDPQPSNSSSFDWQAESWSVWVRPSLTQNAQLLTVPSPYHPNTSNNRPNSEFLEAFAGEGDYDPQDGWGLVAEVMGMEEEVPARWPQFVLYNRHESKLRYFAYLTDISNVNDLEVQTSFGVINGTINYVSAAFGHLLTPMNPIEGFQPAISTTTTPNEFYGANNIWMVADIPISYDPCTCLYPSRLSINTYSTDYETMELTLNGGGTITQVIEEGTTSNSGGFFSNLAGSVTGGISKGNSAFKSATSFASQANKVLVKRANDRMTEEIRDNLVSHGFPEELSLSDVEQMWDMQQSGSMSPGMSEAIGGLFPEKISSVVPDWLSDLVPFGSSAVAVLDFLIGGGKKKEPKPMQFQADFNFTGNALISDKDPQDGLEFQMPGSQPVIDGPEARIPMYNSIMGIMNLVETPVLYRASRNRTRYIDTGYEQYYNNTHKYSYKLAKPLKYAINPASGLELVEIRTALDFRGCQPYYDPLSEEYGEIPEGLNTDWTTPMMPLSCMEDYSLQFETATQTQFEEIHFEENCNEVYLKVVAVFKQSDPTADEVIYDALYNVSVQEAPYAYPGSSNPYLDIPNSIEVDNVQELLNTGYTAWGDITINQSFVVTQQIQNLIGPFIGNQAGGDVIVTDSHNGIEFEKLLPPKFWPIGSEVSPPIVFSNPPDCGENDPVEKPWLESFCNDVTKYNPILALVKDSDEPAEAEKEVSLNGFQVSPNPATDQVWVRFELLEDSRVSIRLTDMSGREIANAKSESLLNAGKYQDVVSVAHLTPGMYLLVLEHEGGRKVSKVVKQ